MISTSEFKKGVFIELENVPYQIVEFQHVKPGKGNAFVRTRIRNLMNNNVIERTFKSGEKVGEPALDHREMQFLYRDRDGFQFMDMGSFEQVTMSEDQVGDAKLWLIDNMEIEVLYYQGKPIALDLPNFVELEVIETEPGVKGDTVSGGGKPAKLKTGVTVSVPFHIKIGDVLKVDTRTGEYIEKIK